MVIIVELLRSVTTDKGTLQPRYVIRSVEFKKIQIEVSKSVWRIFYIMNEDDQTRDFKCVSI